ncbi:hypothetical protein [Psychroflexus tropicus]|uniref:hypothetical protein n=1 Tax=Psychroflexus tropicus TaxID=197345 RepID=UPI00035CDBDD|nr:hypothetical protein [Psychroflexus tropicus]
MENNYINFKKERDLGAIISDTFKFVREEYKTIFRLYLKHVGWLLLLIVAASTYYQYESLSITGNLADPPTDNILIDMFASAGIAIVILTIISIAYSALSVVTINSIIKSYIQNQGEIKDDEVKTFIGRYFGNTLLSVFAVGLLVGIGILLCLLPGIYLVVPLSLIFSVIVFQEKSFSDAFSECFQLIKQNWWITFATLLVVTILMSIIGTIFQIPVIIMSVLETVVSLRENEDAIGTSNLASNWLYLVFYVIGAIAQYILSLITFISIAFIFFNLNEIHHKTGTLEDIERIGS